MMKRRQALKKAGGGRHDRAICGAALDGAMPIWDKLESMVNFMFKSL